MDEGQRRVGAGWCPRITAITLELKEAAAHGDVLLLLNRHGVSEFVGGVGREQRNVRQQPLTPEQKANSPLRRGRIMRAREGGEVAWPADQVERWPIDRLIP